MKKKIEILKGFIKNPDYINDFKEAERLLLLADEVYRATIHDFQVLKIKIDKGFIPENSFSEVKGKTGEIIEISRKLNLVKVKAINIIKKHQKPTKENKGGIISKESFIHYSNVKSLETKKETTKK
jgi:large subunit ribosomal protein L24